jgi:hypothetical protein
MSNDLGRFFTRDTRDNGETFVKLTDDCPSWLHDAVRDAHDGELPNDWRYETCRFIVSMFDDGYSADDDDAAMEIAESLVDVYNYDLARWLADDVSRSAYCDDFVCDGIPENDVTWSVIRGGQYMAIERMCYVIAMAIVENADDES